MKLIYKKAGLSDMDILVETRKEVLKAVFKLPEDADMSAVESESREYYAKSLADGTNVSYLVYDGEEFAGCGAVCFYNVMPSFYDTTGLRAYIMNMYTRPAYRNRGIAAKTLELLVGEAENWGVKQVTLETTEAGRSVYSKFGFRDMKDQLEYNPGE